MFHSGGGREGGRGGEVVNHPTKKKTGRKKSYCVNFSIFFPDLMWGVESGREVVSDWSAPESQSALGCRLAGDERVDFNP